MKNPILFPLALALAFALPACQATPPTQAPQALAQSGSSESEAGAQRIEPEFRASFNNCWKRAKNISSAKMSCIKKEMNYQDAAMNKNYQLLLKKLPEKEKELLLKDQRQWLTERDTACRQEPAANDPQKVDSSYCKLYRTALQAHELSIRIELEGLNP